MGSKERLVLIVLSVALAGGLVALVLTKGKEREDGEVPKQQLGSPAPEGWNLANIPSAGAPLAEDDIGGVIVQIIEEGEGDPIPTGRPMDLQYRVFTLDGVQRMRGTWTGIAPGAENQLSAGVATGIERIKMFERRRLLIPADKLDGAKLRGFIPPNREIVVDLRPVRIVIEDLHEGSGRSAKLNDQITVHYVGKLEDGTVFDSSVDRRRPGTFRLSRGGLIQGWVDAIPGMRIGGKRRLWIPSHLAYGARSPGRKVPPYSDLMFDIELLGIK